MSTILELAQQFGSALDQDNFSDALHLLDENCSYDMGSKTMTGSKSILQSYEDNMKEGRAKFDELIWGQCEVKQIAPDKVEVYFSDFLKHKGIEHNYQCKQILTFLRQHRAKGARCRSSGLGGEVFLKN